MFARLWQKIKTLWRLAKSERASPHEIFWAVFLGAFAGCTPAVGIHGWVGVGLATLFKKNRLMAWIGTRISNMLFLPFIAIAEVQIAHRVRTGAWAQIDLDHAMSQAGEFILDWCLGTIPVGVVIGILCGLLGYGLAVRRDRRRAAQDASAPSPAEAPKPSSESPA